MESEEIKRFGKYLVVKLDRLKLKDYELEAIKIAKNDDAKKFKCDIGLA